MNAFAERAAVITGAGSGIGRAPADALASEGVSPALSGVDTAALAATVRRVEAFGADVEAARVDVSEREAAFRFPGIERSDLEDVERIMNVDFWGVVNFSKAFLPHLIASGEGHLVNVSSLFGLMSLPGQAAYSSPKFAVRGFTESLRQEIPVADHPVKVTCAHPSSVKTAIARNARTGRRRPDRSGQPHRPQAGPHLPRRRGTDDSARRPQEQGTCTRRRRREAS
ncbi:SDR family NAD(P)-dependent oxidoreductase [Streptomyces sp. NPDC006872]|uniref:SDR family NAD(P)-dependent oxidoreductase n=1 Tax=Streptomyces sp. NPDC006872 TaxID=3155720 RepID=UPI0033F1E3C7